MIRALVVFSTLAVSSVLAPDVRAESIYIVLEVDPRSGLVEIVHEELVNTDLDVGRADAGAGLRYRAYDQDGSVVAAGTTPVRDVIRAELSNGPDGTIDGRHVAADRMWAVLRAPGSTRRIELEGESVVEQSLYVTGSRPAAKAFRTEVIELDHSGPPSNRVDMLIVAEGYTAAEREKFEADFAKLANDFFELSPYAEYRGFVNLKGLFVESAESGADHPPFRSSCSTTDPSCCPDRAALNSPNEGSFPETAFDARYCTAGLQRLLTVDAGKVYVAAAAVPDWDNIGVLVNDEEYGGAGGGVWTTSTHPAATAVAQHEYGHSFSWLADEYTSDFSGYPGCSDLGPFPNCEVNVTDETNRARIKWRSKIPNHVPVPTPDTLPDVIGLFEGARYQPEGMFRSELHCAMRTLNADFCEVCSEAYVARLFGGGWGSPESGVTLIEPGGIHPAVGYVEGVIGEELTFVVETVAPADSNAAVVEWWVNGSLAAEGVERLTITPRGDGVWYLEAMVRDELTPERSEHARWTLVVGEAGPRSRGVRR